MECARGGALRDGTRATEHFAQQIGQMVAVRGMNQFDGPAAHVGGGRGHGHAHRLRKMVDAFEDKSAQVVVVPVKPAHQGGEPGDVAALKELFDGETALRRVQAWKSDHEGLVRRKIGHRRQSGVNAFKGFGQTLGHSPCISADGRDSASRLEASPFGGIRVSIGRLENGIRALASERFSCRCTR